MLLLRGDLSGQNDAKNKDAEVYALVSSVAEFGESDAAFFPFVSRGCLEHIMLFSSV